jgi:hypothetical protein
MEFPEVHYAGEAVESGFVFGNRKAGFVEDFAEGLLPCSFSAR